MLENKIEDIFYLPVDRIIIKIIGELK